MLQAHHKAYFAEFIGTLLLVFAGCGAIVTNDFSGGAVTHSGIALTFGLVVMSLIYTFGDKSGAHFNPAVTIGFAVAKRMPSAQVLPYITAQVTGAIVACVLLRILFMEHETLGTTVPSIDVGRTFLFEAILTYILMLVIIHVATGSKEVGTLAGVAIGGVVWLEAQFAGPITGASMNPARSIGPALVSGNLQHLWVYIGAPIVGAVVAVVTYNILKTEDTQTS